MLVVGTNHADLTTKILTHHTKAKIDVRESFFSVTPTQAEIAKYALNAFYSLKVIFGNKFQELSSILGEDWMVIKNIITHQTKRGIKDTHLDLKSRMGFSGHCLPKDVLAISKLMEIHDLSPIIFKSLILENERYNAEYIRSP